MLLEHSKITKDTFSLMPAYSLFFFCRNQPQRSNAALAVASEVLP